MKEKYIFVCYLMITSIVFKIFLSVLANVLTIIYGKLKYTNFY